MNVSRLLPPANEVWGKVIFSEACVKNSVRRGGGSASVHAWITPEPGRHPRTRQAPPGTRHPPPAPEQRMLGDTVNERAVRILLKCILVIHVLYLNCWHETAGFYRVYCTLPVELDSLAVRCIVLMISTTSPPSSSILSDSWSSLLLFMV